MVMVMSCHVQVFIYPKNNAFDNGCLLVPGIHLFVLVHQSWILGFFPEKKEKVAQSELFSIILANVSFSQKWSRKLVKWALSTPPTPLPSSSRPLTNVWHLNRQRNFRFVPSKYVHEWRQSENEKYVPRKSNPAPDLAQNQSIRWKCDNHFVEPTSQRKLNLQFLRWKRWFGIHQFFGGNEILQIKTWLEGLGSSVNSEEEVESL